MSSAKWLLPLLPLLQFALPAQDLAILPPQLRIDDAGDQPRAQLLALRPSGAHEDATGRAQWRVDPADLAELQGADGRLSLRGLRAGEGRLIASLDGRELHVPLHIAALAERPVSFANDVIPLLTKAGCNAGACHGAAAGKNGFGLSLFGYDPRLDHRVLTRDWKARRIDVGAPDQSLLLAKASATGRHEGGCRLPADGDGYRRLRSWIEQGAGDDLERAPALQGIALHPAAVVLVRGSSLPVQVIASYGDGSDHEVALQTQWSSSNEAAATVAADGTITAKDAGETHVLARFGSFAAVVQVRVWRDELPFELSTPAPDHFIDAAIARKLVLARVQPAPRCDDATFCRRVHLDLIGRLPEPEATAAFLDDPAPDKRSRLIDELLERPQWADRQAMAWAELLEVDIDLMERKGATLLSRHLRDAFRARRPFDALVRELLTAQGATFTDAAANFYLSADQPHLIAEKVAQNFLGVRLQCAQCHNHPFENWRMDDYYGFAAFFGQLGRKRNEDPNEWAIYDRRNGEVRNPRDNQVAAPRFLGGGRATVPAGTDRRTVLADWLLHPHNPFFARNLANRLWAQLLGRGLIDPVDDVRVSNPCSHPELLQQLAQRLIASNYDLRALQREICNSATYQRAVHPDVVDAALFAGVLVRRLPAEALLDAIGQVTQVPTELPGLPSGSSASELVDAGRDVRFLRLFGRPTRDSACTCERQGTPTLGQTLHLINGDTIATKITAPQSRLQRGLRAGRPPGELLDDLFVAAYGRWPTDDECMRLLAPLPGGKDAAAWWQDIYWAVLNSKEFTFQH